MERPITESKGCGGLMRVAPIGLAYADAERAFWLGCRAAAITHGHPTGYLSAGFMAALISRLAAGEPLAPAIAEARQLLQKQLAHEACLRAIDGAVALAGAWDPAPEDIETLGAGWVAEEALAIGLACALAAADDFRRGVLLAVNHSGDSDATGAIAGALQAHVIGAVEPSMSSVHMTVLFLCGTILSGRRTSLGTLLGAAFLVVIPLLMQKFLSSELGSQWKVFPFVHVIYGILVAGVAFMLFPRVKSLLKFEMDEQR